jgi:hypothetical protein
VLLSSACFNGRAASAIFDHWFEIRAALILRAVRGVDTVIDLAMTGSNDTFFVMPAAVIRPAFCFIASSQ